MKLNLKSIFKTDDIRFWILIFFIIRLYGITFPPLEVSHNWRQTTVTMVARNFYETDNNILLPRVDMAGEKSGITGMEFPVLNYLIYLVSLIFGYEHWYGRLINLGISSIGLYYFYLLVRKFFEEKTAFSSTIVLLFSIWFTYSRKIMPDTFSMSFILFGLYHSLEYLDTSRIKNLLISCLALAIGTLSKLPSAYIFILLVLPFFNGKTFNRPKITLAASLALSLIFPIWYYFKWVPYLTEHYGYHHFFMGKSMLEGGKELLDHSSETLNKFYDVAIKYIAFAMLLLGFYFSIVKRNKTILSIFILGFIGFLPIMLKGGFTFYHHSYYIIPFVPVMALMSGFGISNIKKSNISRIILIAVGLEGTLNHMDDFRLKDKDRPVLQLEMEMDKLSSRNELILINSGAFPTPMYFAHRKGWVAFNDQIEKKKFVDSLTTLGLKHIIIMKRTFGEKLKENSLDSSWLIATDNEDYSIFSKKNP